MTKRDKIGRLCFLIVFFAIAVLFAFLIGKRIGQNVTSKEVMSLEEYFGQEDQAVLILQTKQCEQNALFLENHFYIPYDVVKEYFNSRFYLEQAEDYLIYTTPTQRIKFAIDACEYTINGKNKQMDYAVAVRRQDEVYLALAYIEDKCDFIYRTYTQPNRIVIEYQWGSYPYVDVKKDTQLRLKASNKSAILSELGKEEHLEVLEEENDFWKVMTESGVTGYVSKKQVTDSYEVEKVHDWEAPVYESQTRNYEISLVWHQVFNQTANGYLEDKLNQTKGVTTVSPTWFSVMNQRGKLSSLVSKEYVQTVHSKGMEIWPLISDFGHDIEIREVLESGDSRERLTTNIMYFVDKYEFDGINIDFETIEDDFAESYIQFLRELSIECRKRGIVLSVDNYVPMEHSLHYNRTEQGIVADYVVVMAYDEYYSGSTQAGSVASLPFVQKGIERTMEEVPIDKIIVGIPFYTRLWKEAKRSSGTELFSKVYSMQGAEQLIEKYNMEVNWEKESAQYYAEGVQDSITYRMWLEEMRSIEAKMKLIHQYEVAGTAAWKLGLEKAEVWGAVSSD